MGGNMSGKKQQVQVGAAREFGELFSRFDLEGEFATAEPYGSGHIHETYRVRLRDEAHPGYILQRVNPRVFPDVPRLMENIVRVTGASAAKAGRRSRQRPGTGGADGRTRPRRPSFPSRTSMASSGAASCFIDHRELGERPRDPRPGVRGRKAVRSLRQPAVRPARRRPCTRPFPGFHDICPSAGRFSRSRCTPTRCGGRTRRPRRSPSSVARRG